MSELDDPPIPQDLLDKFCGLVLEKIGLHIPKEEMFHFQKKLTQISKSLGFKDVKSCLIEFLQGPLTLEQTDALAHHLTIGETYFFRDAGIFTVLKEVVLPDLLAKYKKTGEKIQIWSAACSTGEEPYSIAILLDQMMGGGLLPVSIIGTDINAHFLSIGRQGKYRKWSFRSISTLLKDRYFTKDDEEHYEINATIKKLVSFKKFNLVEGDYGELLNNQKCQLIICNNVLIYFSRSQIDKVIKRLTDVLAVDGWLIVSAVEVPLVEDSRLVSERFENAILFKKQAKKAKKKEELVLSDTSNAKSFVVRPTPILTSPMSVFVEDKPLVKEAEPELTNKELYSQLNELFEKGRYRSVFQKGKEWLNKHYEKDNLILLLLVETTLKLGEISEAKLLCEEAIYKDKLNPLLYYRYGEILQELNVFDKAIQAFQKSLYLDPNFLMAHFAIGNIMLLQNNPEKARHHFNILHRTLSKLPVNQPLKGDPEMTIERLKDIVQGIVSGTILKGNS